MATLFHMPSPAAGTTEVTLVGWLVGEGASFAAGDALVTVETDKAAIEIEAEHNGALVKVLVGAGSEVEVGAPIAIVGEPGEQIDDLDGLLTELGVAAAAGVDTQTSIPVTSAPDGQDGGSPAGEARVSAARGATAPDAQPAAAARAPVAVGAAGRVFASPLARRLAKEAGLPVEEIEGSGQGGRIVRRDVEAALAARPAASAKPAEGAVWSTRTGEPERAAGAKGPAPVGAGTRLGTSMPHNNVPHTKMRRAIARRLTQSKQGIPHFYVRGSARAEELLKARSELKETAELAVSVNDLIVKSVARAHQLVPEMNSIWTEDAIARFDSVDVGLAVAVEAGLLTPVVRGADRLSIGEISQATRDLVRRSAEGGLQPNELEGGSITISNLGMYGTEEFTAIINPPESAILAVGAIGEEPVVESGQLTVGKVLRVVLSVDHRPIDGVTAARWMKAFLSLVEHPITMFA
jgi:pyruvate dehydrogenase E2 component (dihydrolipoamide acetyltransferase)